MTYVAKIQVEMNPALDPWIYRRSQADSHIWMMKTKELRTMKGTHGRKTQTNHGIQSMML